MIGRLMTALHVGSMIGALFWGLMADRFGRRRTLILGTLLMMFAAILFANTREFIPLLIAATIGVISPSGHEVGPFLAVEQASLAQVTDAHRRTGRFAWYSLTGAVGAANRCAGWPSPAM